MPAAKCGGCAKFLSTTDAAKCAKCNALFHRACVALPATGFITSTWCCPECKNSKMDNRAETPVRGRADTLQSECSNTPTPNVFSADVAKELRLFKEELRAEFRLMHSEILELRADMNELKVSLNTTDERINTLDARVAALENKLEQKNSLENEDPHIPDQLQSTIAELKCQLNERDQDLLLNDVELAGITENKGESVLHLINVLATKLGVVIDERDIVHAERVGSTRRNRVDGLESSADPVAERPRAISVRLARRATRDALLRAARVHRGLNTKDLELAGTSRRVYINERLTRINRSLFYSARQSGSQRNWKYVWTRDGRILARKEDGHKTARIRCEEDIRKIFG